MFILTFSFFFLFYMHDDDGSKSSVNSDEAFSKTFGSAWTRLIVVSVFCGGAVLTTKRTGSGCIAAVYMVRWRRKILREQCHGVEHGSFFNVMEDGIQRV